MVRIVTGARQVGPIVLTPRQRGLAMGSAAVGTLLPVLIVVVSDGRGAPATFFIGAALAAIAPVGAILAPPSTRWIRWPCAFGGLPGLTLMQADTGGVSSPYAILLVMGMIWFGLMASDRELVVGLVVTVVCCFAPMLVIGEPAYPVQVGRASALALVNATILLGLAASTRETARLTRRLFHDANHDRLTGLLNRRGWDDVMDSRLGARVAPGDVAVIALVDLDQLKVVNDRLGHDRGDELLRTVGERLRAAFEADVTVARLGGDEFAILAVGRASTDVIEVLAGVRDEASQDAGFSAGVASLSVGESGSDAMRRADLALYEAKATGRHRTCVAGGPLQDALESLPVDRY